MLRLILFSILERQRFMLIIGNCLSQIYCRLRRFAGWLSVRIQIMSKITAVSAIA